MVEKMLRYLTKVLVSIGMLSLMGIVLTIFVNVIARYILRKPILWSMELCSVLVVWSTYVLFGVDYNEDRHFRIEVIKGLLPEKAMKVLDTVVDVLLFITLIALSFSTWEAIDLNGRMILTAMPISLLVAFYIPFTVGIISHFLYLVTKVFLRFSKHEVVSTTVGEVTS